MDMRRIARTAIGSLGLVFLVCVSGCGGGGSTVKGKVSYKGKPVVWGSVTLMDKDGLYHTGEIDLNGNFTVHKVPAGPVSIAVASPNPIPPAGRATTGGVKGGGGEDPRDQFLKDKGFKKNTDDRPKPPAGAWFAIPSKYLDPTTSELKDEVKGAVSEINIDLK